MYFLYFYPLGLDRPARRRPWLSWLLMSIMVVVFVWLKYFPDLLVFNPWNLVFFPGSGSPWTVVTALFMHGSWLHLVGNLIYFQVFAGPIEARTGPGLFLVYFLVLGVAGNLTHALVNGLGLMGAPGAGVMGVSGALAGLIAFSLVRFHSARVDVAWWVFAPLIGQNRAGRTGVPMVGAVALWVLLQVVQALVSGETESNVSFGAHLGGFAMGLILALALGQLREGRIETRQVRARAYFNRGHYFAAEGAWLEYLALMPGDLDGLTELARSRQMVGQHAKAQAGYRKVFNAWLQRGRVDKALDVYDEACRAEGGHTFGPGELARVAYYREKMMDYRGAVEAHQRLFEAFPAHSDGQRALVKLVALYYGKLDDRRSGDWWRDRGLSRLPDGTWRNYLLQEFSGSAGPDAELSADPVENPTAG